MNEKPAADGDTTSQGFMDASKSLQALAVEVQRMAKESIEQSAHILDQLREARTISDVVTLQTTFMQQSFQRYTQSAQRIGSLMQASSMDFFKTMQPPKL